LRGASKGRAKGNGSHDSADPSTLATSNSAILKVDDTIYNFSSHLTQGGTVSNVCLLTYHSPVSNVAKSDLASENRNQAEKSTARGCEIGSDFTKRIRSALAGYGFEDGHFNNCCLAPA
jgi:hypothetical protein